jgi:hypothetical protein
MEVRGALPPCFQSPSARLTPTHATVANAGNGRAAVNNLCPQEYTFGFDDASEFAGMFASNIWLATYRNSWKARTV